MSPRRVLDASMRSEYLTALTDRFRVLDLSALEPDGDDDHIPVLLREVFVPQLVRADPPPVELPRDLLRKLVESNDLAADELPEEVDVHDRDLIQRALAAHIATTPRSVLDLLVDPRQRHVVILGDPGAGKSSLLRYLALGLAADLPKPPFTALAGSLPIVVELRAYANNEWRTGRWSDGTLLDFFDHQYTQQGIGLPHDVLENHLTEDGRAVVMFDGLDELFDPAQREEVTHRILGFARKFPRIRIVVTSRVIGYRRALLDNAGFGLHTLQDLDDEQIKRFVVRWYQIACRSEAAEAAARSSRLLDSLVRSPSTQDLARNPMLLTILAVIGRRRELPKERHRVYQHAVDVLTQRWDPNRAIEDARVQMAFIDESDKRALLHRLARRMQEGRSGVAGNHLHHDELLAEFRAYMQEEHDLPASDAKVVAKAMLEQFRHRNFILARFGPGLYGFVHRAFLEFCCADEIVYRFKETREIDAAELSTIVLDHADEPAWQEVVLLVAGMVHDRFVATLVDDLLDQAQTSQARLCGAAARLWMLAMRCLAETRHPARLPDQCRRVLEHLIENLRRLRLFGSIEPPIALDPDLIDAALPTIRELASCLSGADYLAWFARSSTSGVPGPGYRTGRVDRLPFARLSTLLAGMLGAAEPALLEILARQATRPLGTALGQFDALWNLRHLADRDAAHAVLLDVVRHDCRPAMRERALDALAAGWPTPASRDLIVQVAETDPEHEVRAGAVALIAGTWPDAATADFLVKRLAEDLATQVRLECIKRLVDAPSEWTMALLWRHLADEVDYLVRDEAMYGIWHLNPGSDARDDIDTIAVHDPHHYLRWTAVDMQMEWPDDRSWALVHRCALTDHHALVRQAAVERLASVWPENRTWRAIAELARDDPHADVRVAAVRALCRPEADAAQRTEVLARIASDVDPKVRSAAAVGAMAAWANDEGRQLAHAMAVDAEPGLRAVAVAAIATNWPDADGRRLVEAAITDVLGEVRTAAVQALIDAWPGAPARLLLRERLLLDSHSGVREAIVAALRATEIDDATHAALVRAAIVDPDSDVRSAALTAAIVGRPTGSARQMLVDAATGDPDATIRTLALTLLTVGWPDDERTPAVMRHAVRNDGDEEVRVNAVIALCDRWPDSETRALLLDPTRFHLTRTTLPVLIETWPNNKALHQHLVHMLGADDPKDRETAIELLAGHWPNERTRALVAEQLVGDPKGSVRAAALATLARYWPAGRTPSLIAQRLIEDPDESVRELALGVVLRSGTSADAVAAATATLHSDPSSDVRKTAITTLLLHHDQVPNLRPALLKVAADDESAEIRSMATVVLARRWPDPDTRNQVTALMRDRTDPVADEDVLTMLATLWRDAQGREVIRDHAERGGDAETRRDAVMVAAAVWPDKKSDEVAHNALGDLAWEVREAAISILLRRPPDPSLRELIEDRACLDDNEDVRRLANLGLQRWWPDNTTRDLVRSRAAADSHGDVRAIAANLLLRGWPDHPGTRDAFHDAARRVNSDDSDFEWFVDVAHRWPDRMTRDLFADLAADHVDPEVRVGAALVCNLLWPNDRSRDLMESTVGADADSPIFENGLLALLHCWPDERTYAILERVVRDRAWTDGAALSGRLLAWRWPDDRTIAVLDARFERETDLEARAEIDHHREQLRRWGEADFMKSTRP